MAVGEMVRGEALVTGANSGIGLAVAERLVRDGYRVTGWVRGEDRAGDLEQIDGVTVDVVADVGDRQQVIEGVDRIAQRGKIAVIAHVAGGGKLSSFSGEGFDESLDNFEERVRVNLLSAAYVVRAALPHLRRPGGSIVLVSSTTARDGGILSNGYPSAKAGLEGFTKEIATELGPQRIRVNCVAPGFTQTSATETFDPQFVDQNFRQRTPLGRLGSPEDIAGAVSFLAGPDASFVTGHTIPVNGGYRYE